ncbi:hypothetical protein DICVIV_06402 [Dictyocaulus viviparus]|uniref:Uncharacterized protein n=1 Tax=Dictyocaulus viviparus TaxID=29172 RepID=A0A0D8XSK2_DICVI|nr:hypothetical protein DICVIV_06402 [Dictyocaulus viviparus]
MYSIYDPKDQQLATTIITIASDGDHDGDGGGCDGDRDDASGINFEFISTQQKIIVTVNSASILQPTFFNL